MSIESSPQNSPPYIDPFTHLQSQLAEFKQLNKLDKSHLTDLLKKINTVVDDLKTASQKGTLNTEDQHLKLVKMLSFVDSLKTSIETDNKTNKTAAKMFFSNKDEKKELISSLNSIDLQLKELQIHGMVQTHFKNVIPKSGKFAILVEKFLGFFITESMKKLKVSNFFAGNSIIGKERLDKKINQKEAELTKLRQEIKGLTNKIKQLESEYDPKTLKLELILDEKALKLPILEKELETLKMKNDLQQKAESTRGQLKVLGAERVKIKHESENVTLDGMYCSCDEFKSKLREIGAQTCEISVKPKGIKEIEKFTALSVPRDADQSAVMHALSGLGTFNVTWTKIDYKGQILLVPENTIKNHVFLQPLTDSYSFDPETDDIDVTNSKDLTDKKSEGGTVLLTSGSLGIYEMHKLEILSFLMKGMNVMTINFRGYGESTGYPSENGLNRDIEAAYNFIKEKTKIDDNKILIKGLCMSGGAATHLAAKHPEVNLFLDQTYSNFEDIALKSVEKALEEKFPESILRESMLGWVIQNLKTVVKVFVRLISPAWKINEEIGNVKGNVALLVSKDDELVTKDDDLYKNYQAAIKSHQAKSISILEIPGEHSSSWLNAQEFLDFTYLNYNEAMEKAKILFEGSWLESEELDLKTLGDSYKNFIEFVTKNNIKFHELDDLINKSFSKVAEEKREMIQIFLQNLFTEKPGRKYHPFTGMVQVDNFLKKAQLSDNLLQFSKN